jgi:hypothetical protein
MAFVDDVARSALSATGSEAGLLLAIRWASERYRQLASRTKFRHLRQIGELVIPADITTGTITVTEGEDTVTGNATALAAWSDDLVGRYFRGRRNWYRIEAVNQTTGVLKLASAFTEDSLAATDYHIVPQRVRLDSRARYTGAFVHMRMHRKLVELGMEAMDFEYPARVVIAGSGPEVVAEVGVDTDGTKLVELYPYATQQEMIRYAFWPVAPELRPGSALPLELDPQVLRDGTLIDVMRFEMAKALRANQVEVAATWRNEARAQETTWEKRIDEAIKSDHAQDDVTLILHTRGRPLAYSDQDPWIRTGREDAYSRLSNWP